MKKKVFVILMFIFILISVSFYNDSTKDYITKTISYNGNNLRISIDGEVSSTLPTSGTYYLVDYDCKSSNTKVEWDKTDYKLNISNGNKKGGVSCYLEFKSKPLLSEMPKGSYVAYVGDSENGCDNTNEVNGYTSCSGKNANYVSDIDMGYCNSTSYDFIVNGWRIAYTENSSAYLVSAGATDCMCTDSSGNTSSSSCSTYLSSTNLYMHFENMNNIALKYCNKDYAKDGVCISNSDDNNTVWAMDADDFKKITGNTLSNSSCYGSSVSNRFACGYTDDLIDNGGYYWYATSYSASPSNTFNWYPQTRRVSYNSSNNLNGVRPVLVLESSVIVSGGEGTYENPYEISIYNFIINNGNNYISDSDDKSNVQLSLFGSDIDTMCISVDTTVCTNYIDFAETYTLDLTGYDSGEKIIYVYYKNSDDKIIFTMNKSITLS